MIRKRSHGVGALEIIFRESRKRKQRLNNTIGKIDASHNPVVSSPNWLNINRRERLTGSGEKHKKVKEQEGHCQGKDAQERGQARSESLEGQKRRNSQISATISAKKQLCNCLLKPLTAR